jgi:hypothetical protein
MKKLSQITTTRSAANAIPARQSGVDNMTGAIRKNVPKKIGIVIR